MLRCFLFVFAAMVCSVQASTLLNLTECPFAISPSLSLPCDATGVPPGTLLVSKISTFTATNGFSSGSVVSAVYKNASGTLDFYYQVTNNTTSTNCGGRFQPTCDPISRVTMFNFSGFLTQLDIRTDALSVFAASFFAPLAADTNGSGYTVNGSADTVGYQFNPPFFAAIQPGQTSSIMVISTDAASFTDGMVALIDGGITTVSSFQPVTQNTPGGSNVTVQLPGPIPVAVTFTGVSTPGVTTVTTSNTGPPPPANFQLGSIYFDISTSSLVTPPMLVCITYPGVTLSDSLLHFESGQFQDRTVRPVDVANQRICASVQSLSPFVIVRPIDTTPPVITPTVTGTLGANGWYISPVSVAWSVNDPESGIASSTGCGSVALSSNTAGTTLTCSATNGVGLSNSVSATIKIDQTPPVISGMPAACTLWPPNNKMVQVATVTAMDALSGLASFKVTGTSSEPSDQNNPDIAITPNGPGAYIVLLRAARDGNGSGRVYTISASASDVAGNSAIGTATCVVPHDQGY